MKARQAYIHLTPGALTVIERSIKERVNYIRSDHFIPHTFVQPVINEVNGIVTDPSARTKGVAVIGSPNSGKSTLGVEIERLLKRIYPADGTSKLYKPITRLSLSDVYRTDDVYKRILQAIDAPWNTGSRDRYELSRTVIELLIRVQCWLLILDEFSDVIKGHPAEQRRVLGAIKNIMNEARVRIVALGDEDLGGVFVFDRHLAQRFTQFELPTWKINKDLQVFLKAVQADLPLKKPSSLLDMVTMQALIEVSDGVTGVMMGVIKNAAIQAIIDEKEFIDAALIRKVVRKRPDYSLVT